MLGFSVALQPDVLWYAFLGCVVGTLVGVLPGIGPLAGIEHPAAGDLRPRRHQGDRDAGRHLLRLAIRRLDHLDPDADTRRGRLGDDLHRRPRHGPQGPRRRGAVHRRGRLLHRRHAERGRAHGGGAAARDFRAAVRPAGIHRAAGARPGLPRLHVVDVAGADAADGVDRAPARHHRHRRDDRPFPLQLRHQGARRRHRHRAGRGRPVRPRRDSLQGQQGRHRTGDPSQTARIAAEPRRMAPVGGADRARHRCSAS